MSPVNRDDDFTSISQITVKWDSPTFANSGYSSITSYNLQFDSGTNGNAWINLAGVS